MEINDINWFFGQICKLCQEYVKQRLIEANWPIPSQFEPPSDDKRVCLLCKLANLRGDLLVFEDLKFFDLIDPNSQVELDNLNLDQFDLNLLLKLLKIDFKTGIIALQNHKFNFEDLSFSSPKIVPLGFDFYVIANIVKSAKNHSNFKNLIQIHFPNFISANTFTLSSDSSNNCTNNPNIANNNSNNNTTTTSDDGTTTNNDNQLINKKEEITIDPKDVLTCNLREAVLGVFLGEFERVREGKVMALFSKVCQDKLLMEQLSRIKINVNFEPNFQNRGNYFHCSLHVTRDLISFTGYYNKFSRNMSQTPWLIDSQTINNVEKCIGLPLKLLCRGSNFKLISCGREDVNVRTLGVGRRVSLEVSNCKIDLFLLSFLLFHFQNCTLSVSSNNNLSIISGKDSGTTNVNMVTTTNRNKDNSTTNRDKEDKLLKDYFTTSSSRVNNNNTVTTISTTNNYNNSYHSNNTNNNYEKVMFKNVKVEVNNRRIRKEMQRKSEENKKRYNCLVFSESEIQFKSVQLLESRLKFPLQIKQRNPVRISHRRAQDERLKSIFSLKLNPISPRLVLVDVTTEAGVYVKEFVNGDLGRSRPNLASMIGAGQLRLLFLDVVSSDFEVGQKD